MERQDDSECVFHSDSLVGLALPSLCVSVRMCVCVCARHRKREGPGHSIFNCCTTFSSPSAPGSDVSVWLNLPSVFGRRKKYLNTLKMIVLYTFTIGLFIENMSSCSNTFRCNVV